MEEAKTAESKESEDDTEEEKDLPPPPKKQKVSEKQLEALAKGREKKRQLNQQKHKMLTGHTELEKELNKLKELNTQLYKEALEKDIELLKSENEKLRGKQKPRILEAPITSIERVQPPPPPAPKKEVPAFVFF